MYLDETWVNARDGKEILLPLCQRYFRSHDELMTDGNYKHGGLAEICLDIVLAYIVLVEKMASPMKTKGIGIVVPGRFSGLLSDRVPLSIAWPKFEWFSTPPSLCWP